MKTPRHGWSWVCGRTVGAALFVLLSALALPAQVTNYYVDEGVGNNSYDGLSDMVSGGDVGPKFNVSAAISIATGGSIIQVDSGDYAESVWDSGTNSLTLDPQNDVTICGADLCDADTVGDGIPDWWRLEYFSTPTTTNAASCASCDVDGSGLSNLQDYLAGIDPTNLVNNLPAAACFTNQYGIYGESFITIAPAFPAQGIFYQGDPVTISNSIGTTIEVYDFRCNTITNAAPPVTLTNLAMGHYFVQVDGNATTAGFGDRSQFSVWPQGYTNYSHADIGMNPTGSFAESNRVTRLAPGFSRMQQWWGSTDWTGTNLACAAGACGLIETNGNVGNSNSYDFTTLDSFLYGTNCPSCASVANPPVPVKVINIIMAHTTNGWYTPMADMTNSLSSWVNDVAVTFSNLAVRYGTNAVYEIMNEPGSQLVFPIDQDPYNSGGVYPASVAVSAAVQAVRFVCTNCQTWAPSDAGLANDTLAYLTNTYAVPGYTNVDAITFHANNAAYGPVDATLGYTNVPLGGGETPPIWLPEDSNDLLVAKIYNKPFYTTEQYPYAPDDLGKSNSWWLIACSDSGSPTNVPLTSWSWYTMTMRWWKTLLLFRGTGVLGVQHFIGVADAGTNLTAWDQSAYCAWDSDGGAFDYLGCGPRPILDGQAMISWWLHDAKPVTNWISGTLLQENAPTLASYSGTPGLHFWTWEFANGSTNTFIWADEQINVPTNFGVGLTDIWSNEWTGPIGIEPVIAWGWHGP